MCSEEYSIVWSDHQRSVVGMFERFLDEGTLVDCTVATEGKCLKAHRLMLSACSSYFELLFSQEEKKDKIVVLEDLKFEDLESLIAFVYRGEVTVPKDRLRDFVSAAESLQIKGLPSNVLKSQREKTEVSVVCRKVSPAPHTAPGHVRCSVISGKRVEDEHRNVSSTCRKENGNKKPCTTTLVLEESMLLQQPFVMNNEILSLDTESLIEPKEEVDVQDTPIWENEEEAAKLCNSATTSEQFPRERSQVDTDCASPLVSSTPSDWGGVAMVDSSSRVQMELIAQSCSIKNEHTSDGMIEIFASDSENIEPMETVWVEEMRTSEREDEIANTDSGDIHNRETLNKYIGASAASGDNQSSAWPALSFRASPSFCMATGNNRKRSAKLMKRKEPNILRRTRQRCNRQDISGGVRELVVEKEQQGVVDVDKEDHVMKEWGKKREVEESLETVIGVEQNGGRKGKEEAIASVSMSTSMITGKISAKSPKFLRTVRCLESLKQCLVCMTMFDDSGELKAHMRTHTDGVSAASGDNLSSAWPTLFFRASPSSSTVTESNKLRNAQLMKPDIGEQMKQGCNRQDISGGVRELVVEKELQGVVDVDKEDHVIKGRGKKREVEEALETNIGVAQNGGKKGKEEAIASVSMSTSMMTEKKSAKSPKFFRTVRRLESVKQCLLCTAMFDDSAQLKAHMRTHTDGASAASGDNLSSAWPALSFRASPSSSSVTQSNKQRSARLRKSEEPDIGGQIKQGCNRCGGVMELMVEKELQGVVDVDKEHHEIKGRGKKSEVEEALETNISVEQNGEKKEKDEDIPSISRSTSMMTEKKSAKGLKFLRTVRCLERVNRCLDCMAIFDNSGQLKAHLRAHTDGASAASVCPVLSFRAFPSSCTATRSNEKEVSARVVKTEEPEMELREEEDEKDTTRLCSLIPVMSETKSHNCPICQEALHSDNCLQKHMENLNCKCCKVCKATFTYNSQLKRHMRIHTGKCPFSCEECGRSISDKNRLTIHQRSHSGERPFQCDACKISFSQNGSLKVHMWKHADERPFQCDVCKISFNQNSCLK